MTQRRVKNPDNMAMALTLRTWMTDEMKFHTTPYNAKHMYQLPPDDDLKTLCQKPLGDIWKYVIHHIRSVQTVRQVKGNLKLKHNTSVKETHKASLKQTLRDEEQINLQRKKAQLLAELSKYSADVKHLEKDISHLSADIVNSEADYQTACQRVKECQMKKAVLSVARDKANETTTQYSHYVDQMDQLHSNVVHKTKEASKDNYISTTDSQLETESCHCVRQTCYKISNVLHKCVNKDISMDEQEMETDTSEVRKEVEEIGRSYHISTLLPSLVSHTLNSAKAVRANTLAVNITEDAQALGFSCGKRGNLRDVSRPPTVQTSVQQLLHASNRNHLLRWFKEQEHQNESWKLEARLDDMILEIHKLLHKTIGENNQESLLLAKKYVDILLQLAAEQSVSPCLKPEVDDVVRAIEKAKFSRDELREKHRQIQDFRKLVETRQAMIGKLARHNSSAPARHEDEQTKLLNYQNTRPVHLRLSEVSSVTSDLSNWFKAEVDKFSNLSMSCLTTVNTDCNTCVSLVGTSVAPCLGIAPKEYFRQYSDLCHAVNFPMFKSADKLFLHILELLETVQDNVHSQECGKVFSKLAQRRADMEDDIGKIVDLKRQAEEHEQKLLGMLMPQLQKRIKLMETFPKEMATLRNQVSTWWEQPAQFTTPWVKMEDMTFDQWMQRWRVVVTLVHKRMSEATH